MSKGKSGGGGQNDQRINFESGYAAFKPGATAVGSTHPYYGGTVQAGHPMFPYYQAGWNKAQQDYEAQQKETDTLLGMLSGQREAANNQAAEMARQQREYSIMSNPAAKYGDVASILGNSYAYAWDPGARHGDIVGAWTPVDEQTFNSWKDDRETAVNKFPSVITQDNTNWSDTWKSALEGEAKRDEAYGQYMDAANSAIDYINDLVDAERSNAGLLGIDYQLSDEDKQDRINNYFATLWSDTDQKNLQDLFDKWGSPEGFTDWLAVRGNNPDTPKQPGSTLIGSSQGMPKKKQTQTTDTDMLSKTILLGA